MKKMLPIFIAMLLLPIGIANKNSPPSKPIINGPTEGGVGKTYTYTAVSTDPDGDKRL